MRTLTLLIVVWCSSCASISPVRTSPTISRIAIASVTVPEVVEVRSERIALSTIVGVDAIFDRAVRELPADLARSARKWTVVPSYDIGKVSDLNIMLSRDAPNDPTMRGLGGFPPLAMERLRPTHPLRDATVGALATFASQIQADAALVLEVRCGAAKDVPVPAETEKYGLAQTCSIEAGLVGADGAVVNITPLRNQFEALSVSLLSTHTTFHGPGLAETVNRLIQRLVFELGVMSGSRRT